ncbi:MAG: hypothetical protein ACREAA_02515 [Candidatus Polarisedimenticolia bacterium]
MELFAVGFLVLIATAAFMGVVVGAIGGAAAWRLRSNLVVGFVLTVCAFFLVLVADQPGDFIWLRAKLTWGVPPMSMTFLVSSVFARWLETRTTLRPNWIALAALGVSLSTGFLCLLLFRISPGAPLLAALGADLCLVLLVMWNRRPVRT